MGWLALTYVQVFHKCLCFLGQSILSSRLRWDLSPISRIISGWIYHPGSATSRKTKSVHVWSPLIWPKAEGTSFTNLDTSLHWIPKMNQIWYFPPWICQKCEIVSCSVMYDSLQSHGLSPTRLLCPWNSPARLPHSPHKFCPSPQKIPPDFHRFPSKNVNIHIGFAHVWHIGINYVFVSKGLIKKWHRIENGGIRREKMDLLKNWKYPWQILPTSQFCFRYH